MFDQTFVASGKTRRDRWIALALTLQVIAVLGLMLMPLISIDGMGRLVQLTNPPMIITAEKEPPGRQALSRSSTRARFAQLDDLFVQRVAPETRMASLDPGAAPDITGATDYAPLAPQIPG